MEERHYLLWLSRVPSMNFDKMEALLKVFKSAENIFKASNKELLSCGLVDLITIEKITQSASLSVVEKFVDELSKINANFYSFYDEKYPSLLREIPNPPMGIYVLGEMQEDITAKVGVIGARRCSEYGLTASYRLSYDLASSGVTIVSGMARGIDSEAHKGALDAQTKTIAVLGCGIDVCYPPENKILKQKIIENGCIISEYPPKTPPLPAFFPARNRIISGISLAIIVVEAAKKSGTNITVNHALEQGREVFAVPGNITSKLSEGTNEFIKQGASPVLNYEDVIYNLRIKCDEKIENKKPRRNVNSLTPAERYVYNLISTNCFNMEFAISDSGLTVPIINSSLISLELNGYVERLSGQNYKII